MSDSVTPTDTQPLPPSSGLDAWPWPVGVRPISDEAVAALVAGFVGVRRALVGMAPAMVELAARLQEVRNPHRE